MVPTYNAEWKYILYSVQQQRNRMHDTARDLVVLLYMLFINVMANRLRS